MKKQKGDERMDCPLCGKPSKYPNGGVCMHCYAEAKEMGYWAKKFSRMVEQVKHEDR